MRKHHNELFLEVFDLEATLDHSRVIGRCRTCRKSTVDIGPYPTREEMALALQWRAMPKWPAVGEEAGTAGWESPFVILVKDKGIVPADCKHQRLQLDFVTGPSENLNRNLNTLLHGKVGVRVRCMFCAREVIFCVGYVPRVW